MTFSGAYPVKVIGNPKALNGLIAFKRYENGEYSQEELYVKGVKTRHPRLFECLVMTKKSWGLWKDQWVDGVVEGSFSREEIFNIFKSENIKIPEPFKIDFLNRVHDGKIINFIKFINTAI